MPNKRAKKLALKRPLINTILLLVKFSLIWLGQLPILTSNLIVKYISIIAKIATSIVNLILRKRGRPRKTPFLQFYYSKTAKYIKAQIPKPARIAITASLLAFCLIIYTFLTIKAAYQLPHPNRLVSPDKPLTTEIYDRNNKLLYRLYEGQNRSLANIDSLPPYLLQATIAIEDKNFYRHFGLDPMAILRAIYHNFSQNRLEGASTITQQLIKNTILTPEQTYERKIKEVILAFWTERLYSKKEILQMYLSEAPYGGPAIGIEAASQTYFNKNAKDLSLPEASYLAGLPASPTQYSPFGTNPEWGKSRQKEVLRRMREDKLISEKEEQEAYNFQLVINSPKTDIKAPHFVMYIKDVLSQKYGPRVVSQGGLKITTTLDLNLQYQVESIVSSEIDQLTSLNVQNGAAMVTDSKTGQILAMVGSRDYYYPLFGNYNGTLASRQPGSSIKSITYATAFGQGYSPGNTIVDSPITFSDNWGNSYSPVNYDGAFHGPVSLRVALGSSYNIPAVKLLSSVGMDAMITTAKNMGITTFTDPKRYGLSLTLGAGEVRMVDMMSVYGTLSQQGIQRTPTGILKVTDSNGNILDEYENSPRQVLKPEVAYLVTNVLADNNARSPAFGSNSLLKIDGFEVAVKTGTSDNKRDNWTFGYTPDYVVGVWVGNNDNTKMDPKLASGVTGAAPIWNKVMHILLDGHIPTAFIRPAGVIEATIDGRKDLAIAGTNAKLVDNKQNRPNPTNSLTDIISATYSALTSSRKSPIN